MPATRKIQIPLAGPHWLAFFTAKIQSTLKKIRAVQSERFAVLTYCECASLTYCSSKDEYVPPQTWGDYYGTKETIKSFFWVRGNFKKPPHGTEAGFVFHFDKCPVLTALLLQQIAEFDFNNLHQNQRLAIWQHWDPGAKARLEIYRAKRDYEKRKRLKRQAPLKISIKDQELAARTSAEWHEIEAAMGGRKIKKGDLSKAAHDEIFKRQLILKNWPSVKDFTPPWLRKTHL